MHKCTCCGEQKKKKEFHKNISRKNGLSDWCKECSCLHQKKVYDIWKFREKKYGVNREKFEYVLNLQKDKCGICCGAFKSEQDIHLDHDHKTGKFRGILCFNCNRSLGGFQDSVSNLHSAIVYLGKEFCSCSVFLPGQTGT